MRKYNFLLLSFIPFLLSAQNTASNGSVDLAINGLTNTDSVSVFVWDHLISESKRMVLPHRAVTQKTDDGCAAFHIPKVSNPVYFSLVAGSLSNNQSKELLTLYLAEPGDSVQLDLSDKLHPHFSGRGMAKYHFTAAFDSLIKVMSLQFQQRHSKYDMYRLKKWFDWQQIEYNQSDSLLDQGIRLLKTYRKNLSPAAYSIFFGKLVGLHTENNYNNFTVAERLIRSDKNIDNPDPLILQLYKIFELSDCDLRNSFPGNWLKLSVKYIYSRVLLLQASLKQNRIKSVENAILKNYRAPMKDAILSCWVMNDFDFIHGVDSVLYRAIRTIKDSVYKIALVQLSNRLSIGATAYDFMLQDTKGQWTPLNQFRGKTVILDFWFTGCMGCIQLYNGMLKKIEKETDSSFVVISICVDTDKTIWLSSIEKGSYTSANAINLTTGVLGNMHPVINRYGITAYPGLIMIDKNGKILHHLNAMRNIDTLRELIKKAGESD